DIQTDTIPLHDLVFAIAHRCSTRFHPSKMAVKAELAVFQSIRFASIQRVCEKRFDGFQIVRMNDRTHNARQPRFPTDILSIDIEADKVTELLTEVYGLPIGSRAPDERG